MYLGFKINCFGRSTIGVLNMPSRVAIAYSVNMSSKCLVVCLVLLTRHFITRHQTLSNQILDTLKQTLDTFKQTLSSRHQTLDTFNQVLDTFKQTPDTFNKAPDIFNKTPDTFPFSINLQDIYKTLSILSIIFGYFCQKIRKLKNKLGILKNNAYIIGSKIKIESVQ